MLKVFELFYFQEFGKQKSEISAGYVWSKEDAAKSGFFFKPAEISQEDAWMVFDKPAAGCAACGG